jgi:hypothetical protein
MEGWAVTDDLVERVAQLYWDKWQVSDHGLARKALAIALEEAALVSRPPSHMLGSADSYANGYRAACADIAAAIRAMIPNGNDPARDDTGNAG